LRIVSNVLAINSYSQYGINNKYSVKNAEDAGYLNKQTGYGAMGLILPGKMRGANHGLSETSRDLQESITAVQSDEDTLQKAQDTLQRMHELATLSAGAANQDSDRTELDLEYTQYKFELSNLGTLWFNGIDPEKVDPPAFSARQSDNKPSTTEDIINTLNIDGLGDIATAASAKDAIANIGNAAGNVSAAKERLGGIRSKLEGAIKSNGAVEKQKGAGTSSAGKSKDIIASVRKSLLSRSSTADLAHANVMPQGVLRLIS